MVGPAFGEDALNLRHGVRGKIVCFGNFAIERLAVAVLGFNQLLDLRTLFEARPYDARERAISNPPNPVPD